MLKERLISGAHRLGCSIILSMLYVTAINILASIIVVILNMFQGINNIQTILQTLEAPSNEFLNLLQLDTMDSRPFSILFTAVFMVSFICMTKETLKQFMKSKKTGRYMALAYVLLLLLYYILHKIIYIPKIAMFVLALISIMTAEFTENFKSNIVVWTSMNEEPRYRTANIFSITALLLSTLILFVLINLATLALSKFLDIIYNVLDFHYIFKFIISKCLEIIKYLAMLMAWMDMGNIHDSIIAKYYENGDIRY